MSTDRIQKCPSVPCNARSWQSACGGIVSFLTKLNPLQTADPCVVDGWTIESFQRKAAMADVAVESET